MTALLRATHVTAGLVFLLSCTLVFALMSCRAIASDQVLPDIILLQGPPVAANLAAIDGIQARFRDAVNRERTFSLNSIVRWGRLVDPANTEQVLLVDGSVLIGRVTAIERAIVVLESNTWGEITLPRRCVMGIVWQPPAQQLARWQLRDRIAGSTVKADELTLTHDDQLQGRLLNMANGRLWYETTTGVIMLKTSLVSVWRGSDTINPDTADSSKTSLVGLQDGSLLTATSVMLGDNLHVELRCGVSLTTLPAVRPAEEQLVTFLQPANPAVTFLSDLQPLGYKHIPLLNLHWTWQADRNVLGGPLSAAGHLFAKGLGMHSTSRLAYALEGDYDEFQAEVALDQSAGQLGSVVFRVFTSGDVAAWKMIYKSEIVRGGTDPVPIRARIVGARRLALVVDFADHGDQLDRANWIDARLVRWK